MKTFTNIKIWSTRAKNAAAALFFLVAYTISMVAPFVPVAHAENIENTQQTETVTDPAADEPTAPSASQEEEISTEPVILDEESSEEVVVTSSLLMSPNGYDQGCGQSCGPQPRKGSITIVKDAKPNSPQDFSFTTTGLTPSSFKLDDDAGSWSTKDRITFSELTTGANKTYIISEDMISGWDLKDIVCDGSSAIVNGRQVAITLTSGEDVKCTFTNLQRGKIIVSKATDPANDTTSFPITISPSSGVTGTATRSLSTVASVTYEVAQGTPYSISEDLTSLPNWQATENTCTNRMITEQTPIEYGVPTLRCTIKNTKQTKLTLVKNITNDNGGTAAATDWTLKAAGPTPLSGVTGSGAVTNVSVSAGKYDLSEIGSPIGYMASNWVCTGGSQNGASVTLSVGQNATCTITNDDKAPSLTLTKHVNNRYNGQLKADAWTLSASGTATPLSGKGFVSSGSNFKAGTYTLSESGPSGYDTSSWNCGNKQVVNGVITIKIGEAVACSVTNSDRPVTISGHKKIANTDMSWVTHGMNPVNGWTIYLDQNRNGKLDHGEKWTKTDSNGYYSFTGLNSNTTYYVSEVMNSLGSGWAQISAPSPVFVTLSGGASTNNDFKNIAQGTITVIKNVDDGFGHISRDVETWKWSYDGKQQDGRYIATGSDNAQTVPAGTYEVREQQKPGYHVVASKCTTNYNPYDGHGQYGRDEERWDGNENQNRADEEVTVKVGLGQDITCTFTNKRDTGTITVHKKIANKVNPKGWTWWLEDNGKHNDMGDTVRVAAGSYWFGENQKDGYSFESLECKEGRHTIYVKQGVTAKVHIGKDDHIVCTFTNTRDTGSLTIVKDAQPNSSQEFAFTIEPVSGRTDQDDDSEAETILPEGIVKGRNNNHSEWYQHGQHSGGNNPTTSFTLTDNGDGNNSQLTSLPTGKYRVSETAVKGWDLSKISCGETKVEIDDGVVYLYITKGAKIVCTFTNTQRAHLTIVKDVQPGTSSNAFSFTTNAVTGELGEDTTFSLTDDGTGLTNSKHFENLLPGTYTVTEQADSAWKLDDIICSGTGVTMSRDGAKLTVTLATGAVASCTFANSFIPQVLAETYTTLANTGTSVIMTSLIALLTAATAICAVLYRRQPSMEVVVKK